MAVEHPFATLADSIEADEAAWRTYCEYEKPEVESLPDGLTDKLGLFEQMLVLRCLRVDRVTIAVTNFVIAKKGGKYVQPPVLDYNNIYTQTTSITPVVFVLSPGADPAFDVFKLGEEMGFKPGAKLKYMALGCRHRQHRHRRDAGRHRRYHGDRCDGPQRGAGDGLHQVHCR